MEYSTLDRLAKGRRSYRPLTACLNKRPGPGGKVLRERKINNSPPGKFSKGLRCLQTPRNLQLTQEISVALQPPHTSFACTITSIFTCSAERAYLGWLLLGRRRRRTKPPLWVTAPPVFHGRSWAYPKLSIAQRCTGGQARESN